MVSELDRDSQCATVLASCRYYVLVTWEVPYLCNKICASELSYTHDLADVEQGKNLVRSAENILKIISTGRDHIALSRKGSSRIVQRNDCAQTVVTTVQSTFKSSLQMGFYCISRQHKDLQRQSTNKRT